MIRNALVDLVVRKTADYFRVRPEDILGACRDQEFVRPRFVAIFLARELTGLGLQRLGAAFGRDHTSIMYALRQVNAQLANDARLAAILELLRDLIGEELEAAAGEGEVVVVA